MNRLLSPLLLALLPTFAFCQHSLLWEISGNGLSRPSYLYGTMHVSDKIAFHLTDSFFLALKGVDVVALETNPEHWVENDFGNPDRSRNYEYSSSTGYSDEPDYLYGDFYRNATAIFIPDDETYLAAYSDNNWLINSYLYRYSDPRGDYGEDTYLDLFIFQCGKKLSKQIAALEEEQEVLRLLKLAYDKPREKNEEEENAEYMEKKRIQAALEEDGKSWGDLIDEAYRSGNLERLDSLEIVTSPSRRFRKYFIDDRNRNMVRRMDSIMQSGRTVFTGIGAAHLPGQYGAIKLLQEMGYTVRPVTGKITNKSIKEKEKLESLLFQQEASLQYAYDSLFSVVAPGKLYETGGVQTNNYSLYPDMANSAYYSVKRIAHHAYLKDKTPEVVLQELEEMFYEYIPGDIQTQTAITTNNGWPGYDILSKTKRGSYLRYRIVVSPLEVIIFKASGIGEFVLRAKEAQTFFNTIKFAEPTSAWRTFRPAYGLFTLDLPAPFISDQTPQGASVDGAERIAIAEGAAGNDRYYASVYYLNDFTYIESDSFELIRLTDMFMEDLKDAQYVNRGYTMNTSQGYPTAESTWENGKAYIHTRSVIKGPYYFFLSAYTTTPERPEQYFQSLKLQDFQYSKPFTAYTDTSLYFTVSTIFPAPDTTLTMDEIEYGGYNDYGYYYKKNDDIDRSYLPETRSATFSSEVTPENIFVQYHKYHDYVYFKEPETFWNSFDTTFTRFDGFTMTRRKFVDAGPVQSLEFMLTDSFSTRGIYKKFIQKDNALFQLSTVIDTAGAISPFVVAFYDSFTPSDSVDGRSIFESPADMFFSNLNGSDTMKREQAIRSIDVVNLNDTDATRLIQWMQDSVYYTMELDKRESFIRTLGDLKHPDVVPALKKIYVDAGDTMQLQTSALRALSGIRTKEATQAFTDLLYIETPLAKKNYSFGWLFSGFNDSLELAEILFPEAFDFIAFPEYQYPVYRMLAELMIDDSTNIRLYEGQIKQLISQATAELKRNLSYEDEDSYSYNTYSNDHYFPKLRDITDNGKSASTSFYGSDLDSHFGELFYIFNEDTYSDLLVTMDDEPEQFNWAESLLDHYSILLTPFYDDPAVKKYFDRILRSEEAELKLHTALTMLEAGLPVADSIWLNMQKDRSTRYAVISELIEMGRKDKIDTAYGNQRMLCEGILYQYELTEEGDSIAFVDKRFVSTPEAEGYIYFFRSKMGRDKGWSLDCTGIQPADTTQIEVDPMFIHFGNVILDDADMEEQIDEILSNLELIGRSRVRITFGKKSASYSDWDDY